VRTIVIDAVDWLSEDDFFDGILEALDAPDWHGRNWSALNDSIVTGGVNRVEPPYHLHLTGDRPLSEDLREWVQELVALISDARTRDREVSITVAAALGVPDLR
jgi:RNAse (barnase) inhibitor barstar